MDPLANQTIQDIDLDKAINAFNAEQKPLEVRRTEVIDDSNPFAPKSKLAVFLIKLSGGIIKNEEQANYALLGSIILILILSLVLFFTMVRTPKPPSFKDVVQVAGPSDFR